MPPARVSGCRSSMPRARSSRPSPRATPSVAAPILGSAIPPIPSCFASSPDRTRAGQAHPGPSRGGGQQHLAHEILGQSIVHSAFVAVWQLIGRSLLEWSIAEQSHPSGRTAPESHIHPFIH